MLSFLVLVIILFSIFSSNLSILVAVSLLYGACMVLWTYDKPICFCLILPVGKVIPGTGLVMEVEMQESTDLVAQLSADNKADRDR